jgi:hypothetical protein
MRDSVAAASTASRFPPKTGDFRTKLISLAAAFPVERAGLIFCIALAFVPVVFFLLLIQPLVFLRADLLMWEETDFVGNIIKFNTGAPLYTAPEDSNSLIYNPAAFVVTYAIAWIFGLTYSVAGLRLIQIGFVVCAALLATVCARKLYRLAFPERVMSYGALWAVFTFLALFLAATTPYTNKFVYVLHVDALALLVSVGAFWAMLRYAEKDDWKNLLLMAIFPAVGFLTKQFLIGWTAVMLVFLLIYQPRNYKRLAVFAALSIGFIALAFAACYLLWGDNWIFWTFEVMGGERKRIVFSPDSYSISLVRSADHLIRVWAEIFVGVIGGWFLLRGGGQNARRVAALAGAWLALVAGEAVSSGASWSVLYHFGPGVLTGAIFMFAALPAVWTETAENKTEFPLAFRWARVFVLTGAVAAIFLAWNVVPNGDKNHPRYFRGVQASADVDRYVADIEREFEGQEIEKVLLGVGNWIYLRRDVLQKDRAVSLADQPLRGMYENFDVTVKRIRGKTYRKILVQDFHTPFFLYDWSDWERPSGVRAALLENYVEIRLIEPPKGNQLLASQILNAGAVSVFVPLE